MHQQHNESLVTIFQLFSQSPPRGHRFSTSFATLSITRTKYWPVNWSNKRTHNKDSGLQARMWTDAWRSGRPWWPKILEPLIRSSKPAMKTAVVNHPNTRPFRKTWPQSGICKRVRREMSVFENTDQLWMRGHVCEDKKNVNCIYDWPKRVSSTPPACLTHGPKLSGIIGLSRWGKLLFGIVWCT